MNFNGYDLSLVFDCAQNKVVITDDVGNIKYANAAFANLVDISFKGNISKNLSSFYSNKISTALYSELWKKISSQSEAHGELCFQKKSGEIVWDDASVSTIDNQDHIYFLFILTDSTKRKALEDKCKETDELYQLLTNSLPVSVSYVDTQLRYRHTTSVFEKWFGIHSDSSSGNYMQDHLSKSAFKYIRPYVNKALKGERVSFPFEITLKNKSVKTYDVSYVPHITNQGTVIGIYMLSVDMSDYINSKHALKASEEKYQTLVESSPNCIYSLDLEGNFSFINANGSNILNRGNKTEIIGMPFLKFISDEDKSHVNHHLEIAYKGQATKFDCSMKNGRVHVASISPIFDANRKTTGVIGIANDITERRQAEEDRNQLLKQLHLAQKMEAIGKFTGGVAHDFNNILASMLGYASLTNKIMMSQEEKNQKPMHYLKEITQAGKRGKELVKQMMIYSRSGYNSPEIIEVAPLIESAMTLFEPLLPERLNIQLNLIEEISAIKIDPVQFEQVLMNLIVNSRDAISDTGEIKVTLSENSYKDVICGACHQIFSGNFVELSVSDSGEGISPDDLSKIFDPFFTTKPQGKGTGMGLAVVHGIVHEAGGHIVISSREKTEDSLNSTCFKLLFPCQKKIMIRTKQKLEKTS